MSAMWLKSETYVRAMPSAPRGWLTIRREVETREWRWEVTLVEVTRTWTGVSYSLRQAKGDAGVAYAKADEYVTVLFGRGQ